MAEHPYQWIPSSCENGVCDKWQSTQHDANI